MYMMRQEIWGDGIMAVIHMNLRSILSSRLRDGNCSREVLYVFRNCATGTSPARSALLQDYRSFLKTELLFSLITIWRFRDPAGADAHDAFSVPQG
jgi:hypothetical protein